jgi:hypothetical protein
MNPIETIVPIFAIDEENNIKFFLGTGTFVEDKPWLVTAEHVIRDWNGLFAISVLPDTTHILRANLLTSSRSVDIALLEVPGYPANKAIQLAQDDEIQQNLTTVCCEYGTTQTQGKYIHLAPATQLGNVTRQLNMIDRYDKAGEDILELSFPALRGASGAPVLSNTNFRLWGIVIANISYHLLPVQIESVLDEKNKLIEEIHYLLPQALAVHVKHVRALIQQYTSGINGQSSNIQPCPTPRVTDKSKHLPTLLSNKF